jgi:hypothetical protein
VANRATCLLTILPPAIFIHHAETGSGHKSHGMIGQLVARKPGRFAGSLYGRGVVRRKKGDIAGSEADIAAATAIRTDVAEKWSSYGLNN